MQNPAPWAALVLDTFMTQNSTRLKSSSFRKPPALIPLDKSFVADYKLAGLDRRWPLSTWSTSTVYAESLIITALELLFQALLAALGTIIYKPVITRRLPSDAESLPRPQSCYILLFLQAQWGLERLHRIPLLVLLFCKERMEPRATGCARSSLSLAILQGVVGARPRR